jgi:hypothetical protein
MVPFKVQHFCVVRHGKRATLKLFADADHSFHVPARTGRKDAQVLGNMIDAFTTWPEDAIAPFVKKS